MNNEEKNKAFNRRDILKLFGFGGVLFLSACGNKSNSNALAITTPKSDPTDNSPSATETDAPTATDGPNTETPSTPTDSPTDVPLTLEEELAQIAQPLELPTLGAEEWKSLPIIPISLSDRMIRLFALGQKMGLDARSFSVVGDCQTIPGYFLGKFDSTSSTQAYFLGEEHAYLQETIDYYKGSFEGGVAAHGGQNVAAVFSPFWVQPEDAALCDVTEGPLACELRLQKPAFTFISLEENWNGDVAGYTVSLEKVILYVLAQGVIPILATKANNLEGDHAVNQAIVEIARRYEIPLWNFWASLQELPQQGLDNDRFHLTFYLNGSTGLDTRFDFRESTGIDTGWAMRNLTALQFLDFLRKTLAPEIGLGHQFAFVIEQWIRHS